MNDVPLPLTDDHIDELLSAELDGEFDAAAADLGLSVESARAQLESVAGIDARRAAMRAARAALAAPVDLDELAAGRLRAAALQAVRPKAISARGRRSYGVLGAVAAAVVLVLGVAFAIGHSGGSSSSKASRAAVAGVPPVPKTTAVPRALANSPDRVSSAYLGEYSDEHAIAKSLSPDLFSADDAAGTSGKVKLGNSNSGAAFTPPAGGAPTVSTACDTKANQLTATTGAPAVRGTASIKGVPVLVYVFRTRTTTIVLVLTTDCQFVSRQAAANK